MRLAVAVVCFSVLVGLAWSAETVHLSQAEFQQMAPPVLQVPPKLEPFKLNIALPQQAMYAATFNVNPGVVYRLTPPNIETVVYQRPQSGRLTSFDYGPWPWATASPTQVLYFSDATIDHRIFYSLGWAHEASLVAAPFVVREVDLGPGNQLYVSEAYGAAADGKIWKLGPGHGPILYYTVKRAQVGGRWYGHFAFDPAGTLHISNGYGVNAKVWRCPLGGVPSVRYIDPGPVLGFHFVNGYTILYASGTTHIKKVVFGGARTVAFSSVAGHQFTDIRLR